MLPIEIERAPVQLRARDSEGDQPTGARDIDACGGTSVEGEFESGGHKPPGG